MINIKKNEFITAYFKRDVHLLEILYDEHQNDEYFKKSIILTNELNSLNNYPYIVCKHELSDISAIHALEATGFQLISVDIKLKTEVSKPIEITNGLKNKFVIERINQKYENNFVDLLSKTQRFFDSTHFYKSPYLDNHLCDYFYKGWILEDVKGRTNENYIVSYEKEIIGFIFGNKEGQKIEIDLLWVSENFRKAGVGKSLILSLIKNSRCNEITVKTQIDNDSAVKLYTKIGFNIIEIFSVFHRSN